MASNTPFHNYPTRYPRARRKAAEVANAFVDLTRKGPRSLVASVVDTSFHVSQGYVTATTQLGVVNVFSVPYGAVVPGMRIFVRQIGGMSTNRSFLFDGMAPNLSALGSESGSVVVQKPILGNPFPIVHVQGVPTAAGLSTASGYYWHLCYYLPGLPPTGSAYTIFSMLGTSGDAVFLELLSSGLLRFRSTDGRGYVTSKPVPPHNMTWVVIQPGVSGQELLINGQSYYTGITIAADAPTFGASSTYSLSYLSSNDGSQLCPVGSWVSKMGYGASYSGGVVPLSVGTAIPAQDSDLPSLNAGVTQHTIALYLAESFSATATLTGADIGSPSPAGSDSLSRGLYTVSSGYASGITNTTDSCHFVSENLYGDIVASARLATYSGASGGVAGLMCRAFGDSGAAFYGLFITNATTPLVLVRTARGSAWTQTTLTAISLPIYLKVTRVGNTFAGYTSSDGVTWSTPQGVATLVAGDPVLFGCAVSSFTNGSGTTGTFDTLTVANGQGSGTMPNSAPTGAGPVAPSVSVVSAYAPVVSTGPY